MLPIWSDYFIHGVTIASFGSPFSSGVDMELAGVSRAFYHYAPFMIPQHPDGFRHVRLDAFYIAPFAFGASNSSVRELCICG